ncbi:tRNA pseudouridine(55) synthase TruB [Spongiibacter sp. KMU-158]|uniref:tRNA pseudouridine synthase B n=1 Tax=Spongiibacter pelagi TaxID=2760804 RepID=A0A927C573_9GAMM|nr:tRNA pseudouridine(55) synthase TruB [Spongiibacter pelagi]MBD2860127.1 tRNA pseudouridine(55) synthase TruB [Spongiibacter pelagi]
MARRRKGRQVDGILILDKPTGRTSNGVMVAVRAIYNAQKAGHTGALDPLASGVLPICLGEATKFSQYLLDADKAYLSGVRFGQRTDTLDAEGEVVEEKPCGELTAAQVEAALVDFRGDILQVPPMYSALKRNGRPLYELARAGIEVERPARPAHISRFDMLEFNASEAASGLFDVACSKGTYIRSLTDDLGQALGVGAHIHSLRRTQAGPFNLEQSYTLDHIQALRDQQDFDGLDALLLPIESALGHLPSITLPETTAYYLLQGQAVQANGLPESGQIVLFDEQQQFLGVGEVQEDGRLKPKRLIAH